LPRQNKADMGAVHTETARDLGIRRHLAQIAA
jgi:hypothetical protein